MNKIYKQVERLKNEIKEQEVINNKINETNTLLQIKSLFRKICFQWHLKFDRELRLDISLGRLFQSFGAA